MPRERKAPGAARPATSAKGRHRLRTRENVGGRPAAALVAKLDAPKISKHKTYFEFAENADKKKKLEVEVTDRKEAPPGFTFVPFGNPELTSACKEISRENEAMIFIVSDKKETKQHISDHVHRLGYHFRSTIVEQASIALGGIQTVKNASGYELRSHAQRTQDTGDPIPDTQEEINAQADGAIRDLFPRIPNTDREMIIQHAFQKGAVFMGKPVVGLQKELTLSRRVQLAVIAHVRHTHTRYDMLLRETDWATARAMVEPVCLDIIVKWRGDEETGRDQLDEVLREVVVISDSEESDDEDGDADESSSDDVQEIRAPYFGLPPSLDGARDQQRPLQSLTHAASNMQHNRQPEINPTNKSNKPGAKSNGKKLSRRQAKKARVAERKGFKRYRAWNEALSRQRQAPMDLDNPENQPQHQSSQTARGERYPDNRDRTLVSVGTSHQNTAGNSYPVVTFSTGQSRQYPAHVNPLMEANHIRKVTVPGRTHPEESYARQPVRYVQDSYGSPQRPTELSRRPEPYLEQRRSPNNFPLQDLLVPSIEKGPSEGTVISTTREPYSMYDERRPIPEDHGHPASMYVKSGQAEPDEYTDRNGIRYKRQRIANGENSSRMATRDGPIMAPARDNRREVSPQRHLRHATVARDNGVFVDLTHSPQRAAYPYDRSQHEQPRFAGAVQSHGDPRAPVIFPTRPQRENHETDSHQGLHRIRHVVSHATRDPLPPHIIARENTRPGDEWQNRGLVLRQPPHHQDIPVSRITTTASTRPMERISGAIPLNQTFQSSSHRSAPGPVSNSRVEVYPEDPRYVRGTGFVREAHQHSNGSGRGFRESSGRPASPERPIFRVPAGYNSNEGVPQTRLFEHQKHLPIYDAPPRGVVPVRRHPENLNLAGYDGAAYPRSSAQIPRRDVVVLD